MPGEDGLAFAARLRAEEAYQDLRLILLSSVCDRSQYPDGYADLFEATLIKPVRRRQLLRSLLPQTEPVHEATPTLLSSGDAEVDALLAEVEAALHAEAEMRQDQPAPSSTAEAKAGQRTTGAAADPAALGLRVLVAEDNPVNQKVAERMLRGLGCEVTLAANGEEAVEQALSGAFDLVLMDCQMPVMDGFTATAKLRERERREEDGHLPIIAMTANAMQGDRQRCLEAGMDDYLSKPVRKEALGEMLRRWASQLQQG